MASCCFSKRSAIGRVGVRLGYIVEDDEGIPAVGLTKARKLVESDSVHLMAGALLSSTGYARVIRRLRDEGTTVVLAEQNAAFAVKVADHAHVMSKGRVVHSTDPATLWADEDIKTRLLGVPAGGSERPRDASV